MSAIALTAVVALGVWKVWPAADSVIAVPDRVCDASIDGSLVSPLLPERGEPFKEERFSYFGQGSISAPGKCYLSAGGEQVSIAYVHILSPEDYSREDIERDAAKPGSTPVSLGNAKGYADARSVSLFTGCRSEAGRETLVEVKTSISDSTKDETALRRAAALTAEVSRSVTPRMKSCTAEALPQGDPTLG
ncbi:hypothetical protein [Streptomyces sp. NPDC091649]|uniref:hypothetical protein n=1 Tax=Streptomyces sp. NPDC091649 TaxID=3366004 RepID=UPI00381FD058